MASRISAARLTFRDLRDPAARLGQVTVRDITFRTRRDRRIAEVRAAAGVWPAIGPITLDHDAQVVFARFGGRLREIGRYSSQSITPGEAQA